ncbi:MAG: cell division topological specificity factor MinE [Chloroflexi bacterium]|nr:cell division topological specificity factor MinE [Chloroflexota bacterium]
MDFFNRILGRSTGSANAAKERLQLVLAHDRTDLSAETLEVLKDEIVNVISKHIAIDRARVEVSITRSERTQRLVANIPLASARRAQK